MRRLLLVLLALTLGLPTAATAAPPELTPYAEGPDREPSTPPDAVVTVHDKAMFSFGLKPPTLTRTVSRKVPKAPDGTWDRVILSFRAAPTKDEPWDRVFSVAVGKVELLRGTTPRTDMTLRKDVTEYLAALAPGARTFTTHVGTYTGGLAVTVKLELYDGEPVVHAPRTGVVGALALAGIEPDHKDPGRHQAGALVRFGARPPSRATLEVTTTGHLQGGEFWYLPDRGSTTPPVIHVRIDGKEVATGRVLPYVYALAGFEGQNDGAHPLVWWTAQRELDKAGVHTGTGEIPPYRVDLPAETVSQLTGRHLVEVSVDGKGLWLTGVSFLMS